MSDDAPVTSSRKDKKAQRDAERAAKFKKGTKKDKPEPAALPEDRPDDVAEEPAVAVTTETKSKKRKREETTEIANTESKPASKSKKRKAAPAEGEEPSGKKRFIVFVGNLPYTTTDQSLDKHFEKLKPFNLRHRTDPQTRKSKGFAFLEFENYDRLKTCLKIFHHSYFDPDDPDAKDPGDNPNLSSRDRKKSKGRRINVQLSAGGGGSSEARKEKIKTKNERLEGQRTRRAEFERKEKAKKLKAGGDVEQEPPKEQANGGMHPSRLARLQ